VTRDYAAMTSSTPGSPRADANHIGVARAEVREDPSIAAIAARANRGDDVRSCNFAGAGTDVQVWSACRASEGEH
jgi:hypothetical protein